MVWMLALSLPHAEAEPGLGHSGSITVKTDSKLQYEQKEMSDSLGHGHHTYSLTNAP